MKDTTLIILAICAVVSLGVGLGTEGVKSGWYDGAGIVFAIVLVVFVTGKRFLCGKQRFFRRARKVSGWL